MSSPFVIAIAFAVGFMSGLRAFTPIALVSWLAIWGWAPLAGSPFWFIGTTPCAVLMSILAVGELIGDKLPQTSPRIQTFPLSARVTTGAISAGAICIAAGRPWLLGVFLGAIGAIVGAFGGYHARRGIVQKLRCRDFLIALVEDLVAVVGTLALIRYFFARPLG
jgi:uncharacterized membrane protein